MTAGPLLAVMAINWSDNAGEHPQDILIQSDSIANWSDILPSGIVPGGGFPDRLANPFPLVAGQVVHDDDGARVSDFPGAHRLNGTDQIRQSRLSNCPVDGFVRAYSEAVSAITLLRSEQRSSSSLRRFSDPYFRSIATVTTNLASWAGV